MSQTEFLDALRCVAVVALVLAVMAVWERFG